MFHDTPLIMVEDQQTLLDVAERLAAAPVIGVDTESDSFYSYQEKVCLIQFSDREADYIVDPLAVEDLSPLAPILADRSIVKVLHGADYDVVCLKRDFGFEIRNIFDTMIAAQLLALPKLGLGDLINENFGLEIDKQYQRHNWAARPLEPEHLEYARGDTHWLLSLRDVLIRKLRRRGRYSHLKEECRILEEREWAGKGFDPDGYLRMKGAKGLDDTAMRVLRRLYLYRDEQARRMDRPTFKVLSDHILVKIARHRPTTLDDLNDLFPRKAPMKRRHGKAFVDAVLGGMDDDFAIPRPKRKKKARGPAPRLTGRAADRAFNALKDWRNELCEDDPGFIPIGVASNSTLKSIVARRPTTLEELRKVPEVRRWQVREFGEQILGILDREVTDDDEDEESSEAAPKKRRRRRTRRRKDD